MFTEIDSLVKRVGERVQDPQRFVDEWPGADDVPYPPTTNENVDRVEERIGFHIPTLLRRLYTEVANGGFGPAYGIVGIDGRGVDEELDDLETLYRAHQADSWRCEYPTWPSQYLRVVYLGCFIYVTVDATTGDKPLYHLEPNN